MRLERSFRAWKQNQLELCELRGCNYRNEFSENLGRLTEPQVAQVERLRRLVDKIADKIDPSFGVGLVFGVAPSRKRQAAARRRGVPESDVKNLVDPVFVHANTAALKHSAEAGEGKKCFLQNFISGSDHQIVRAVRICLKSHVVSLGSIADGCILETAATFWNSGLCTCLWYVRLQKCCGCRHGVGCRGNAKALPLAWSRLLQNSPYEPGTKLSREFFCNLLATVVRCSWIDQRPYCLCNPFNDDSWIWINGDKFPEVQRPDSRCVDFKWNTNLPSFVDELEKSAAGGSASGAGGAAGMYPKTTTPEVTGNSDAFSFDDLGAVGALGEVSVSKSSGNGGSGSKLSKNAEGSGSKSSKRSRKRRRGDKMRTPGGVVGDVASVRVVIGGKKYRLVAADSD